MSLGESREQIFRSADQIEAIIRGSGAAAVAHNAEVVRRLPHIQELAFCLQRELQELQPYAAGTAQMRQITAESLLDVVAELRKIIGSSGASNTKTGDEIDATADVLLGEVRELDPSAWAESSISLREAADSAEEVLGDLAPLSGIAERDLSFHRSLLGSMHGHQEQLRRLGGQL